MSLIKYYPYVTYNDNNVYTNVFPFITYKHEDKMNVSMYPYITYHQNVNNINNTYYLKILNEKTNQVITCKLYDDISSFPLAHTYLTVITEDGKRRFCPLNEIGKDFDSSFRVLDSYNHKLQLCTTLQNNIINRCCPYGNLLIPLTTIEETYQILRKVFGKHKVQLQEDKIYIDPPSAKSLITKIFAIGLNIHIECNNNTYTTINNGLISTSYGYDRRLYAQSMLVKMHENEPITLSFYDTIPYQANPQRRHIKYADEAPIHNALIIGSTVEHLQEYSDSYFPLVTANNWFIYNNNKFQQIPLDNKILNYFIKNYLNYPHSKHKYNYYDLTSSVYSGGD